MTPALTQRLEALVSMDRSALANQWEQVFKSCPPKAASRQLLLMALSYEVQAKRLGGLTKSESKTLALALKGVPIAPSHHPLPGSVLVREWHGVPYRVEVADGSYLFKGKNWTSLSAIAQDITGARWSGPRFFGVSS